MATVIDAKNHVQINGVNYRLAEDSEGQHYDLSGEPLRPPNAVVVQGEGRQDKFQARPDMLLWNITDWSGGEGQIRYDPQAHSRHAILSDVDPFIRPGTLTAGYSTGYSDDSGTALTLAVGTPLLTKYQKSAGIAENLAVFEGAGGGSKAWWLWNRSTGEWDPQTAYTGPSANPMHVVNRYITMYLDDSGLGKIWTLNDAGGAAGTLTTGLSSSAGGGTEMVILGDYLYFIDRLGTVEEVTIPGGVVTQIDTFGVGVPTGPNESRRVSLATAGPNRVYFWAQHGPDGSIREITPTSAAGPGFGREIARFPATYAWSMWFHQGTLFIGASDSPNDTTRRMLLYYVPGGEYGALGRPRIPDEESVVAVLSGDSRANSLESAHFLLTDGGLGGSAVTRLYQLDTVSGGYAQISSHTSAGATGCMPFQFEGDIFWPDQSNNTILRMDRSKYKSGYAVTPWHDMGLSDEKILSSLILSCEALPADWDIVLSYAVDGSSSFTTAGTYSTDSGTGTRYAVSTDSSTAKFRSLRIKISLNYTGAGVPTTRPVVHGVEVRAQVAKPTPVWNLLLDLSDDHSGGSQSHAGSKKYTNIKTAGDSEVVVDFKDGYPDRKAGVYTSYDVVVDSYHLVLDRPGAGIAAVALRQVA